MCNGVRSYHKIWSLADQEKRGRLSRDGFYLALRLLSVAKQGKPISVEAAIVAPGTRTSNHEVY